jgi:stage II sporulation protein AA (anti-sigma F factor antagonist)
MEYRIKGGTLEIKLSGEIDHAKAGSIRTGLDKILSTLEYRTVIFDLSGLKFMDSTGVGLILGRYKMLREKNKPLCVKNPSPQADKVLRVSGIYSIIPLLA